MPKQSAITRSKLSKGTQEEAVKQAQSQQYKHQSDILNITPLPPPSTLYLIRTPLQSISTIIQHFHDCVKFFIWSKSFDCPSDTFLNFVTAPYLPTWDSEVWDRVYFVEKMWAKASKRQPDDICKGICPTT